MGGPQLGEVVEAEVDGWKGREGRQAGGILALWNQQEFCVRTTLAPRWHRHLKVLVDLVMARQVHTTCLPVVTT